MRPVHIPGQGTMSPRPPAKFRPSFLLSSREEAGSPVWGGSRKSRVPWGRGPTAGDPPPLLLLQLMVADLLALEVQPGILQLARQPLALLLQLLQSPLALITVCLQVAKLGRRRGGWGQPPGRGRKHAWRRGGRARERSRDEGWGRSHAGTRTHSNNSLPLGVPSPGAPRAPRLHSLSQPHPPLQLPLALLLHLQLVLELLLEPLLGEVHLAHGSLVLQAPLAACGGGAGKGALSGGKKDGTGRGRRQHQPEGLRKVSGRTASSQARRRPERACGYVCCPLPRDHQTVALRPCPYHSSRGPP